MTVKSRWQEYKDKNGVTPLDLLNPNSDRVSIEVSDSRLSKCENCEHFLKATRQCLKCGCMMNLKTKLLHAKCPIGRW
jgi:ribosomal protein L32